MYWPATVTAKFLMHAVLDSPGHSSFSASTLLSASVRTRYELNDAVMRNESVSPGTAKTLYSSALLPGRFGAMQSPLPNELEI